MNLLAGGGSGVVDTPIPTPEIVVYPATQSATVATLSAMATPKGLALGWWILIVVVVVAVVYAIVRFFKKAKKA